MHSEKAKTALCLILLLAVILGLFSWSVAQRVRWFGEAPVSMSGWLTAGTCVCARNWYAEGPWNLRFVMYWEPGSVESNLESRTPYTSFPPGAIVPVYLLAKILGKEPSIRMVMAYNLFSHFCIALLLGLLTFFTTRRLGFQRGVSCLFALIPAILYLWFPVAFYEHEMGYFSDQAIMPLFALYALLEVHRTAPDAGRRARYLAWAQGLIAFCGVLTDWLFILVLFCAYLIRLFRGEFGRSIPRVLGRSTLFAMPVFLALLLFALQLHHLNAFPKLSERFWKRTGFVEQKYTAKNGQRETIPPWKNLITFPLKSNFWKRHIRDGFGGLGKPLILGSTLVAAALLITLALLRFTGKPAPPALVFSAQLSFLMLAPCLFYLHVFKEHCSFMLHSFTALKFALPLALLPLAVFPACLLSLFRRSWLHWGGAGAAVLLACGWAYSLDTVRKTSFPERPKDYIPIGNFIAAHTDYFDVVFSPDHSIADRPPQNTAYSKKLVYKLASPKDIPAVVASIPGDYRVCLFILNSEKATALPWLESLKRAAYETYSEGRMKLYKIRKANLPPL